MACQSLYFFSRFDLPRFGDRDDLSVLTSSADLTYLYLGTEMTCQSLLVFLQLSSDEASVYREGDTGSFPTLLSRVIPET